MRSLKTLTLSGVTLAALAMVAAQPAKADPVTTAVTATADVVNLVLTLSSDSHFNYGTIRWTYTQQKR